ncbi:transferrin-binding protein-like solute binding protein [Aquabacterium sp.]|uniref:transferrin-binding protein-like solute binding protein n=1 Tax=Aquabacterium sp. TaxID=1872578 RepID=UPI003D6D49DE
MKHHPPLKALALAVAALLLQAQAQAAPTEAQLNGVKVYGDVTIAQDSVTSWGPWTEFEPPAAGNPPLAQLPTTADLYRTLPQATTPGNGGGTTPPEVPPALSLVGFGGYYALFRGGESGEDLTTDGPHPINVTGTQTTASTGGTFLPDAFVLQVSPITGEYPPPTSMALILDPERGIYTSSLTPTESGETLFALVNNPDAPVDAQANQVSFYQLVSYIGAPEGGASPQVVSHLGVIGYATPEFDMAALKRGNVSATYAGHSLTNGSAFVPMTMDVNFGTSTWNATFNGGANSTVNVGDVAKTAVGFSVQGGVINGSSFTTTGASTFSATDAGSVAGRVNGSFYGPQAAAVGGAYDVTKNGVRYVDPFIGVKQPATTPTPSQPTGVKTN